MPRPRMDNSELWDRYRATGSIDDRNALVVAYLPLVQGIAAKVHRSMPHQSLYDVESLTNAGVPGLLRAIDGFEPERGNLFATYAALPIQGAMLDEVRRHDWVPRLERAKFRKGLVDAPRSFVAFHIETNDQGEETAYGQLFADEGPGPEHFQAIEDFWREQLRGLSQTERLILLLYFREGLRMSQIGAQLGLSESRISQMTSAMLRRLRNRGADRE